MRRALHLMSITLTGCVKTRSRRSLLFKNTARCLNIWIPLIILLYTLTSPIFTVKVDLMGISRTLSKELRAYYALIASISGFVPMIF